MSAIDEPPPPLAERAPPRLNRFLRVLYRALPGLVVGLVLGVLATLAWEVFVAGSDSGGAFTPAPQPQDPDIVLTMSFDLIAALISQEVARSEVSVPLRDIRVGEDGGRLLLRGTFSVLNQSVGGTVELEPFVQDGRLGMRVARARLGRLPLPQNVQRLAEEPLNRELQRAISGLPATLTSVRVSDAGLVVTADVRVDELPFLDQ